MYTLSDIINEKLVELGESQSNKFARFYQFGVSFMRKAKYNTTGFPAIKELTINDNDTADLPLGYVNYMKISLCIDGRLFPLSPDSNLCLNPLYDNCGNPIAHPEVPSIGTVFGAVPDSVVSAGYNFIADNYRNGENMGRQFGIGSDNNLLGYFRINENTNQILFSGLNRTATVVLEYLSDIEAVDGDYIVHPFCIEACKAYIFWQYKANSSKPLGEQQMAHETFKNENRLMRQMFKSSTLQEWNQSFEAGNSQTPKLG